MKREKQCLAVLKGKSSRQMLPSAVSAWSHSPLQIQPEDPCLFIRVAVIKHKSSSKTFFVSLCSSVAVHRPNLMTFLLAQYISNTDMPIPFIKIVTMGKYYQPKTTGFHNLRRGLILSEASFPADGSGAVEQKGDRYSPVLVHMYNNPARWSLPGITASVPLHSSSKMPNHSKKRKHFFLTKLLGEIFIITKNPSEPDSFSSCKSHRFSHRKHMTLPEGNLHYSTINI